MRPDIMVVDDAYDQLQLISAVCRMVNPEIKLITLNSGNEALKQLRSRTHPLPRVILLDLMMPGMSGHEVLKELKADPRLKTIPVCIFSSAEIESEIHECYNNGASFYFKKPSGLDDFRSFFKNFTSLWFNFASHCEVNAY